jgi:hypothetical protein
MRSKSSQAESPAVDESQSYSGGTEGSNLAPSSEESGANRNCPPEFDSVRKDGRETASVVRASLWVPLALVAAPLAAGAIGVRLNVTVPRSPEPALAAARND